jgi:outer membrane receptor protein involved in Fe transport
MNRRWPTIGSILAGSGMMCWSAGAAAQMPPAPAAPPAAPQKPSSEAIVVTATRRSENVNKIPYSITALSGAALQRKGITDLAGLRNSVVGLQAADYGNRAANINNGFIIRGINSEDIGAGESEFPNLAGNTVSNYIDDTPLFVNLKLTDIERVEILRGPQGTLFGADSVGGTVRTIHNKPSTYGFDYQFDGTMSGTDHANQPNSAENIMLNIPVTDKFAVRLNAGYDRNAGFINDPFAARYDRPGNLPVNAQPLLQDPANPLTSPYKTIADHGINSDETWFARADGLYHITDDISAEASYQHQYDHSDGFAYEYPGADYIVKRPIAVTPSTTLTDIGAVTLTGDFGFGTITSSSSYYNVGAHDLYDVTGLDTEAAFYYGGYPRLTVPNYDQLQDDAFSQEVRLVSPKGEYFDYVAGVFYQNRRQDADSQETVPGFAKWANLPGSNPYGSGSWADYLTEYYGATRPGSLYPADLVYNFKREVQFTDLAAFGEGTIHLTPQWNLIGGVRVFNEVFRQTTLQNLYNGGTTFGSNAQGLSQGNGEKRSQDQIFKASTSYALTPNTLAYLLFSQGYRPAGANAYPIGTCYFCNLPNLLSYGPDRSNNYEAGIKGTVGKWRYMADVYWIDWTNTQVEVSSNAGTPIIVNANGARSRGVELEAHYNATDALTLSGGYAYTNAVLTQSFAVTGGFTGAAGALLPGVSRHQVNFSADYAPEALADHAVNLHLDGSYRSGFANQIQADLANYRHLSGFALFNVSAQAKVAPKMTLELFVHNLFNAKGVTAESSLAPPGETPADYAAEQAFDPVEFVTQPLTVGLRLVIRH